MNQIDLIIKTFQNLGDEVQHDAEELGNFVKNVISKQDPNDYLPQNVSENLKTALNKALEEPFSE